MDKLNHYFLQEEEQSVSEILATAELTPVLSERVRQEARKLVESVRSQPKNLSSLERFLAEYDLATEEGTLLMCLAETLLRVPDADTADALIADKIKFTDWEQHIGNEDFLVNASTWALMLTGQLLPAFENSQANSSRIWKNIIARLSKPVIRNITRLAMRIIGDQFIMGSNIEQAIARSNKEGRSFECFSFDMLGEAALTTQDSENFLSAYQNAMTTINKQNSEQNRYSISVKLSALCPRFEVNQWQQASSELTARLKRLAIGAKQQNIQLTIDAEESERLELTFAVFKNVYSDPDLKNWNGLGLAIQAYQKRVIPLIACLADLAKQQGKMIPVRLVKGAYWDSEIKQAQINCLDDYPVFTRKCNTDVSYLAAVQSLLKYKDKLFPQFATHNAHTVAYIKQFFKPGECEFQRLHGMGDTLYESLNQNLDAAYACRVYAPVGSHDSLLPYLIRRLLENGANTSFVHRIADKTVPIENIIVDPVHLAQKQTGQHRHPNIVLPQDLFGSDRKNSRGINFADREEVKKLRDEINDICQHKFNAAPIGYDGKKEYKPLTILNPANQKQTIGQVRYANHTVIRQAIENASDASQSWDASSPDYRAEILEKAADLFQQNQSQLIALCIKEAGKTIIDAHAEVREAIDFLRYYATECRRLFNSGTTLPGPVGESNVLRLRARGIFLCISPWNFPIAIYTGQIAAALAAGNTVLAKPATQTSLTAMAVTQLLHKAGIPEQVLNFIPCPGAIVANQILTDKRIAGVAFTGSNAVAKTIEMALANKSGTIATLIAETGGINAMLVDSSALAEQVVLDVIQSAFNSAGQRCSALRVLYLQKEIAQKVTTLIIGRMQELSIGDPIKLTTDIGPVINEEAKTQLQSHITRAKKEGRLIHQMNLEDEHKQGFYVAPALIKIEHINDLEEEVFGPVLHIIQFEAKQLESICDEINDSGYGLTFGIHSRINHRIETISKRMRVGNVYINRNMVGAVVGSQPFGGCGLSGTGPKAGGQHYLQRFATEQTISINTAAIGGNASLLSMDE